MIVYHLPMLAIADGASAPALEGIVRGFRLDEFAEVDSDWAHGNYFVKSSAVWVLEGSARDIDRDGELVTLADLIRLAAIALLEAPLASPRLSIRYFGLGDDARSRLVGPFERTLLLQEHSVATAGREALDRIGTLAGRWQKAGYYADHPAFAALDAFGAVYTSLRAWPELAMMPPMVALEGIFAPENAPDIAKRMASALAKLLSSDAAIPKLVQRLYNIRSDIIHGRPLDDAAATEATGAVGRLACHATRALIERAIEQHVPPERWTDIVGVGG
jgi:hypothetical protein